MRIELTQAPESTSDIDQRRDERFTGSGGRVTFQTNDGERFSGIVVNESFGGAGMVFDESVPITTQSEIEVTYHGILTSAIVRHVTAFNKGGCMIGMHWKASAIAEQTVELQELCDRQDLQLPDPLMRFIELMPGGVQLMFGLNENERWAELSEAIDRLANDAAVSGVRGTEECLTVMAKLLEDQPDKRLIRKALDELVSRFVQKIALVAETYKL